MEPIEQKRLGARFWLSWVGLNTIGIWIISISFLIVGIGSLGFFNGFTFRIFLFLAFPSAIWGYVQWLVLRSHFQNLSILWVFLTALALPGSMWIVTIKPLILLFGSVLFPFYLLPLYFVVGLLYCLAQWLVLWRPLREVWEVILSNVVSYTIGAWFGPVSVLKFLTLLISR